MIAGSHRRLSSTLLAVLTAGLLWLAAAVPAAALTVTFVRHAQSAANAAGIIDTSVPGPDITTDVGVPEAAAVAAALAANGIDYDAIYTSNMVRTSQTASPFAELTGLEPVALAGFREIGAGIFEGSSENSGLGRIGYALSPALWMLGARSLPILGGTDGNAFDARVDAALEVVEDSGAENPVVFSHGATIMFWTMMNVDNPDIGLLLRHRLGNTDIVVIEGSAEQGWTLKSWAGQPVGPASLGTKLFVDFRDLVVTPQTALYNVARAFRTGDIRQITDALVDGVVDVLRAPIVFAAAVVTDIAEALRPRTAEVDPGLTEDTVPVPAEKSAPTAETIELREESGSVAEPVSSARSVEHPRRADRMRVVTEPDEASVVIEDVEIQDAELQDLETDTETKTDTGSDSAATADNSDPTGGTGAVARKAAA